MKSFIERKKIKKFKKYSNILFKDLKINVVKDPCVHLAICNVGLLTGISEVEVVNYFSYYGPVCNVVMVPQKSYCFITFKELNSAIECFSAATLPKESVLMKDPLHILYVDKIPSKPALYKTFSFIPPGVIVIEDFISDSEELTLSSKFDISSGMELSHRKVKHYGYEFEYGKNNIDKNSPLEESVPDDFKFLNERFHVNKVDDLINWFPDQLTINCYEPGQGIPPHVDTHSAFEDPILSLSILSDTVMEFEKCDKTIKASVLIPKKSLLIMSGEARYFWTHGIIPRKSDVVYNPLTGLSVKLREKRVSFTFRKIKIGECECGYKLTCDSFLKNHSQIPSDETAARIENEFVHKVYENISHHFSLTRHSPWPAVREFLLSLPYGSIVVDIGSGNGKYYNINKDNFHFGGDTCNNLNMICKSKGMEVIQFNCLNVPLKNGVADAVICIAVIHHLYKESRRKQALKEIHRILRSDGIALIYVWSKEQKSTNYVGKEANNIDASVSSYNYMDQSGIVLPVHCNKTEFQHYDLLVPWNLRLKNNKDSQFLRYYHLFEEKELEKNCKEIGAKVINSYYDDGNWCVVFKKIGD